MSDVIEDQETKTTGSSIFDEHPHWICCRKEQVTLCGLSTTNPEGIKYTNDVSDEDCPICVFLHNQGFCPLGLVCG